MQQQPPSRSASSSPGPSNTTLDTSDKSEHEISIAKYGSPYAHNPSWAPTSNDYALNALPKTSIQLRFKQRFARSPGEIFDPPCPSFMRRPPHIDNNPFPPYSIPAKGKELAEGFKPYFPGGLLVPRDISPADWHRFLDDLDVAARLTGIQQVISQVAPITMHLGASGYFVTKAIQKRMSAQKEPAMWETVGVWNERFFAPRGVCVRFEEKLPADYREDAKPVKKRKQKKEKCWVLVIAPYAGER